MDIQLVVVRAFGAYGRGDVIADRAEIARVLADGSAENVVRVLINGKGS
jgi:hypothetical protein